MKNNLSPADIRLKPSFAHRFEPHINGFLRHFSLRLTKIKPSNPERPSLQFVKNRLKTKEGLIGVELGVFRGENALDILKTMNIKHLYLIDPWISYDEKDPNMHGVAVLNEALENTKSYRLQIFRNNGLTPERMAESFQQDFPWLMPDPSDSTLWDMVNAEIMARGKYRGQLLKEPQATFGVLPGVGKEVDLFGNTEDILLVHGNQNQKKMHRNCRGVVNQRLNYP